MIMITPFVPVFDAEFTKPARVFLREPVLATLMFDAYWKFGTRRAKEINENISKNS